MNQVQQKTKINNIIQFLGLSLLLVVFPLGSWYYLSEGFQFQKDAYGELKDYGTVPAFSLITQNEKPFTHKDMADKISVVGFFSRQGEMTEKLLSELKPMQEQFDDREDIIFLMYHLTPGMDDVMMLKDIASKAAIEDWEQCLFLTGEMEQIQNHLKQTYKIPLIEEERLEDGNFKFKAIVATTKDYPFFVLIDTKGKIRNYYNINDKAQITRLVEHLAILMPRDKKKKKI